MHGNLVHSRTQACIKTWPLQLSIYCKGLFQDHLGRVNQALVVGAFLSCQQEVCLCIFEYLYREVDAHELITHTNMCILGGGCISVCVVYVHMQVSVVCFWEGGGGISV